MDSRDITVFKSIEEDESSPDFPIVLPLSTISELVKDLEKFLGVAGVSGIVTFHNSSLKILTNIRQLPVEATVSVIKKKGSDYFKLV